MSRTTRAIRSWVELYKVRFLPRLCRVVARPGETRLCNDGARGVRAGHPRQPRRRRTPNRPPFVQPPPTRESWADVLPIRWATSTRPPSEPDHATRGSVRRRDNKVIRRRFGRFLELVRRHPLFAGPRGGQKNGQAIDLGESSGKRLDRRRLFDRLEERSCAPGSVDEVVENRRPPPDYLQSGSKPVTRPIAP
jgi:hypothetical protein